MTAFAAIPWQQLERLARRDPGRRGVAEFQLDGHWLCEGHFQRAAAHLAEHAQAVAIVTGFAVPEGDRVWSETDGPPGALFLARTLLELGVEVVLISDCYTLPLLQAGCELWQLPRDLNREFPFETGPPHSLPRNSNEPPHNDVTDRWINDFLDSPLGSRLTHLIAIERAGPSHTEASLVAAPRGTAGGPTRSSSVPAPVELFRRAVPPNCRNVCFNMRGQPISGFTAKTHRLFEAVQSRKRPITTIGIGDGGNEIGLGSIPWIVLREAVLVGPRDWLPCRIATDFTLLCGTSNWGAYALALALTVVRGRADLAANCNAADQEALLEHLVRHAGAIDGVTLRHEPTVDGMPTATYLEILTGLRETLGLPA